MISTIQPELGGRPLVSIHVGGMYASRDPLVIRTVLGSCISVCLRDPLKKVGGMNHFMLPADSSGEAASARYGMHAMELLINECMRAGADRRRLEAKVFGGGHVLRILETADNVPKMNIKFAMEFLLREAIPIISSDVGNYSAREIYFFTDSGRVCLRRLSAADARDKDVVANGREERMSLRRGIAPAAPVHDNSKA